MMERFADGNMADVYRLGNVVRKQRGVWWDATRQVLNHLESVAYPWSPRILAESDQTVDLSYIEGKTIPATLDGGSSPDLLQEIGRRTRQLHDVLDGFRLRPGSTTVSWPVAPPGDTIMCHNDLSPWNTVLKNGTFRGFIDWDLVSYGTREWELAWMCWRWAPIYPYEQRTRFDADEQLQRCRILLEAYGLDALDIRAFAYLIDRRMRCGLEVVEVLGSQGVPGFDRLLNAGMHLSGHDDRAWLAQNHRVFQTLFDSL